MSFWTLAAALITISISAYVYRWLLQTTVGWSLRRRTRDRRNLILARVKLDESQSQLSKRPPPNLDDGEWEKVENDTVGSKPNGSEADNAWEGIIGFFHPFWSVLPRDRCRYQS